MVVGPCGIVRSPVSPQNVSDAGHRSADDSKAGSGCGTVRRSDCLLSGRSRILLPSSTMLSLIRVEIVLYKCLNLRGVKSMRTESRCHSVRHTARDREHVDPSGWYTFILPSARPHPPNSTVPPIHIAFDYYSQYCQNEDDQGSNRRDQHLAIMPFVLIVLVRTGPIRP